jgi:hypothetical protein
LEDFFHSNSITHEVIVPLDGVTSPIDEIILDSHTAVYKMPEETILQLLSMNIQLGYSFGDYVHEVVEFAVRVRYDSRKVYGPTPDFKYDP